MAEHPDAEFPDPTAHPAFLAMDKISFQVEQFAKAVLVMGNDLYKSGYHQKYFNEIKRAVADLEQSSQS